MKKTLTWLLVLVFAIALSGAVFAAETLTVTATPDKTTLTRGDIVTVSVSVSEMAGCRSGYIELLYHSDVFRFVSGKCTLTNTLLKDCSSQKAGRINGVFLYKDDKVPETISGEIFTFQLQVLDTPAYGDTAIVFPSAVFRFGEEERSAATNGMKLQVFCAHEMPESATTVQPTCTEEGYTAVICPHCGYMEGKTDIVPALGHQMEDVPAVAPTCTQPGLTAGTVCQRCQHAEVAQKEVPALGHDPVTVPGVASTCVETGLTDGSVCQRCQTVLVEQTVAPLGKHNYVDDFCTVCGAEKQFVTGDLDGVEAISEDDAIYLLQHVLMPDFFPVEQDVDFDGSGTVDEDDAIYLLQHILMPDLFPL